MASVMGVLGPIDPFDLGLTLMHEHLFINLLREYRGDGLLNDRRLAVEEARHFAKVGGRTIVDCTSVEIGRDPLALRYVAAETGLNVIMGCGHYRVPYIDEGWMDRQSVDGVAREIVRDVSVGVGDTGVRAGIIGEVGCDKWYIGSHEERALRGAARAQIQTGVAITTHAARWPVGLAQLDILEEEGVDPKRVIIGHCDTVPDGDYHLAIAERGAFVQFDNVRGGSEFDMEQEVNFVMNLRRGGFLDRILLSHDVCLRSHLQIVNGPGYALVPGRFRDRLRRAGVAEEEIQQIVIGNPRAALTGE